MCHQIGCNPAPQETKKIWSMSYPSYSHRTMEICFSFSRSLLTYVCPLIFTCTFLFLSHLALLSSFATLLSSTTWNNIWIKLNAALVTLTSFPSRETTSGWQRVQMCFPFCFATDFLNTVKLLISTDKVQRITNRCQRYPWPIFFPGKDYIVCVCDYTSRLETRCTRDCCCCNLKMHVCDQGRNKVFFFRIFAI